MDLTAPGHQVVKLAVEVDGRRDVEWIDVELLTLSGKWATVQERCVIELCDVDGSVLSTSVGRWKDGVFLTTVMGRTVSKSKQPSFKLPVPYGATVLVRVTVDGRFGGEATLEATGPPRVGVRLRAL